MLLDRRRHVPRRLASPTPPAPSSPAPPQREKTLTGHTDAVRALAVAGNKVFSASYDGTLKVGCARWRGAGLRKCGVGSRAGGHAAAHGRLQLL